MSGLSERQQAELESLADIRVRLEKMNAELYSLIRYAGGAASADQLLNVIGILRSLVETLITRQLT